MSKKQTVHYIAVKNKKYPYTLELKQGGVTRVICDAAGIDQDFLNEDIPELLLSLPELIISEQEYNKKTVTVQFRISPDKKKELEKKALKEGYPNLSAYLRANFA